MTGQISRSAIASLLLGLLVWFPLLNYFFGIAAIALGIGALQKIKEGKQKGKVLAALGILLGETPFYFTLFDFLRRLLGLSQEALAGLGTLALPIVVVGTLFLLRKRKLL